MKHKLLSFGAALLLAASLAGCGTPNSPNYISMESAQETALNNAQVAAADAYISSTTLEDVAGITCYKVEFTAGGYIYACSIHAETGEIIEADYRQKDTGNTMPEIVPPPSDSVEDPAVDTGTTAAQIDEVHAKEIALAHAGVSHGDATFVKALLDYENGQRVYELEWYANGAKYDYDIAVANGAVLSSGYEAAKVVDPSVLPPASADVTLEQAKQTALDHAGVMPANATIYKAERDYDDGRLVYEIEFYVTNGNTVTEYDYEIDANTGKVLSYDYDIEGYAPAIGNTTTGGNTTDTATVTLETAKQTALDHAGVKASNATIYKAERDYDDGRLVYEIEFYVTGGNGVSEYDYEIDAVTGKIISYDYDIEGYAPVTGNAGTVVSADTAKQTALARVPGATATHIREWEVDYDDGRTEYEGKIIYDSTEYEFTIDAATGNITEWDVEPIGR